MARRARFILPGVPLHIVHRGNDRKTCFFEDADFRVYSRSLETHSAAFECDVHSYVLMTNHVHILVTPRTEDAPGRMMKAIAQNFAQYINRRRGRTGCLWEGRYWSGIVDDGNYFLRCQRYIELNPVKARMVGRPGEYPWSSYKANAGEAAAGFLRFHGEYRRLGDTDAERHRSYRDLLSVMPTDREWDAIQAAVKGGFAWGSEEFLERIECRLGEGAVRRRAARRGADE